MDKTIWRKSLAIKGLCYTIWFYGFILVKVYIIYSIQGTHRSPPSTMPPERTGY